MINEKIPAWDTNPFTKFKIFAPGPALFFKLLQMPRYPLTPINKLVSENFKSYLQNCKLHFSLPPLLKQI